MNNLFDRKNNILHLNYKQKLTVYTEDYNISIWIILYLMYETITSE